MKFNKEIVVGLKFYIGKIDMGDDPSEFVRDFSFEFATEDRLEIEDSTGLFSGGNKVNCEYYDDTEGYMYTSFDKEVNISEIPFFEKKELIYKKIEE